MKMFDEFLIGSWVTYFDYKIMSQEDQMKRLAELGVNYHPFPFSWYDVETRDGLDDWKETDRLCQKYNILYGMVTTNDKVGNSDVAFEKNIAYGKEMSDNLVVYYLFDEPRYDQIPMLAEWVKKYRDADKRVFPAFNLFPSYVACRALRIGYEGYLQKIVDEVGAENMAFLSFDYYPFMENRTRGSIFADLEDVRKVAYRNGKLRTHGFIQANKWGGMRMPNFEEICWQAYSYLAYGFKALSYFNIVSPNGTNTEGFTDGLIMQDGRIPHPELLENIKELNWDIRAIGNELLSTNAVHAYHTCAVDHYSSDMVEYLPKDYYIQSLTEEQPFILAEYDAKDKLMIVNRDFTWEGEAKFAMKGVKAVFVFDPKTKEYKPCAYKDGILTVSFKKGEGFLFNVEKE